MQPPTLPQKVSSCWPTPDWHGVHVGVALSGGADSVALLCSLQEARAAQVRQGAHGDGKLFALHVNHHLRGTAADEDQVWCEQFSHERGVPFIGLHGDVAARASQEGDGIEAAAREERYALLTQAAEEQGIRYLAFGHTQNDQVETILFRILREWNCADDRRMRRSRSLTPAVTLIRPLLTCTRGEVLAYLAERGQPYRTDDSNDDFMYSRNQIRGELLPRSEPATKRRSTNACCGSGTKPPSGKPIWNLRPGNFWTPANLGSPRPAKTVAG